MPRTLLASFCALAVSTSALAPYASGQQVVFPPLLEVRVPKAPSVAAGDQGRFLAYELSITNLESEAVTLRSIEVRDGDDTVRVYLALSDTVLARALTRPGSSILTMDRPRIDRGLRAIAFLWVPLADGATPRSLRHRLTIETGPRDSLKTRILDAVATPVHTVLANLGPPLRGGPWLAGNGPSNESGHRRAMIPVSGQLATAQRFAIDWVKLGPDNRTFTGDRAKNESYHAEGQEVLAVADGIVAGTKDSIPENVPGITSRAGPITLETVGGNYVILDIGEGRFAFYAHLKPGSLRVRTGERVRKGQVLGLVGNSGNSTEPHLHFHLADANSPLGSEGIPYALDFDMVGKCRATFFGCERATPVRRRQEIPLAWMIVQFP